MIPDHYARIAAAAATAVANAPAGKWRKRAVMGLSVEQIEALALYGAATLEDTHSPRRWDEAKAAGRKHGLED